MRCMGAITAFAPSKSVTGTKRQRKAVFQDQASVFAGLEPVPIFDGLLFTLSV